MPYLFTEQGDKFTEEEREKMKKKGWDTNAITPGKSITSQRHGDHSLINTFHTGTPFMDLLAASLRYWVSWKLNNDPGWKNVSRIRLFTTNMPYPEYDPNTSHVIYGLVSLKVTEYLGALTNRITGCRSDHACSGDARAVFQGSARRCVPPVCP
jgi:5'-3' exonuclease